MATENTFDSPIKNAKDTVIRQFSSFSDGTSEKGLLLAMESSSTGEFKAKQHFGKSQELKTDGVNTDSLLDFQKPENLSNEEDRVDLESLKFKKLQLLRDLEGVSIFAGVTDSVENTMMVDGNVIVGDDGKIEDRYEVDRGSGTSSIKIKLIDDTAVIEPFSSIPGIGIVPGHQKKAKRPRRKGKSAKNAKMGFEYNKSSYSRKEMLALRFVGVVKQKRLWREIYDSLGSVADEYASLVDTRNPKPRNPLAPGILGPIAGSGRANSLNMAVHLNIIRPVYAQNWRYVSKGSSPASSNT